MKLFIIGLLLCSIFTICMFSCKKKSTEQDAYNFSFEKITDGKPLSLKEFEGKVIVVVNTASKCGFASQYDALENLYQKYKERGLVVIGIPTEDFGNQELSTNTDVEQFCKINYGVTFPLTRKEHVSGSHAHPFYLWARQVLGFFGAPRWNFHKYLIDRKGNLVDYFYSTTSPESEKFINKIEILLALEK
jgi:glutathione peroxidase